MAEWTTEEVREQVRWANTLIWPSDAQAKKFDAWLSDHDAQVKAEALREAANDENSEWARKRTEDELIEFRDARIGLVNRRNGLVVYERDGEPSSIIRLGFEMAWKSALRDLADRIEREARP